jgi:hypothetical protein
VADEDGLRQIEIVEDGNDVIAEGVDGPIVATDAGLAVATQIDGDHGVLRSDVVELRPPSAE